MSPAAEYRDERFTPETLDVDIENPLRAVVAEIAADAMRAPEHYLRDTIVPAGGE